MEFKTAQIIYKARNNLLPDNTQNMFMDREEGYDLRGNLNLKQRCFHTAHKSMCISVCGVILWNALGEEIKQQSKNVAQFKKMDRDIIFARYRNEEGKCKAH